jgi:hypothetical protein
MIKLELTKRTDKRLMERMKNHYSQPKGFVGRNLCYAIYYNNIYYGHIVAGSATRFLPNRNEFFNITIKQINNIINNIFYNISKVDGRYPIRNFTSKVLKEFMKQSSKDWENKYGDKVIGFETLIEKPRTGELYKKVGWIEIGETIGYTCKRVAGKGTDSWTGKRIWDTKNLRPKKVIVYKEDKWK